MESAFPMIPFQQSRLSPERRDELIECLVGIQNTAPLPAGKLKRPPYRGKFKRDIPPSAKPVIGITGKPRSGKDVAADYLEAHFQNVARVNFSDPIIEEVNQWLLRSGHQIAPGNKSEPLYRSLLQAWGMARREIDPSYWTNQLAIRIKALQDGGICLVLVCGVRTPSDLQMVLELGGECWYVSRPDNAYQAEHAVENALDHLPLEQFVLIENPEEGNLEPYEDNILKALLQS